MILLKNIVAFLLLGSMISSLAMDSRQLLKYGIVALGAGCAGALCVNHFNKKQNELLEKKINESEKKFTKLLENYTFFQQKTERRINGLHMHWMIGLGNIDTLRPVQEVYRECIKKFVLKDDFEFRNKELKNLLEQLFEQLNEKNKNEIIAALVPMIKRHILEPAVYNSLAGSRDENTQDYADYFNLDSEIELNNANNDTLEKKYKLLDGDQKDAKDEDREVSDDDFDSGAESELTPACTDVIVVDERPQSNIDQQQSDDDQRAAIFIGNNKRVFIRNRKNM